MDNPYEWLQNFIDQVPGILQPVIVALAAAIPYIEGEGAAAFGIIAGINPIVAALAAMAGNILCVIGVVLLGSRIRERVVAKRAAAQRAEAKRAATTSATSLVGTDGSVITLENPNDASTESDTGPADPNAKPTRRAKGRARLTRWMVRFGVPGASILAPLALPTMLTAAFFVGSGVSKQWVILWQVIAIVLWTGAIALAATGVLALVGW
ncbi:small multidrug efflux protein [Marisediminicola sp. LYQ134]|uniref:small multidrug efflux protein n=1 Tax=Marisediminicola sp. LYQ134 TaxID=3391061 RepID=UPI003982DD7A